MNNITKILAVVGIFAMTPCVHVCGSRSDEQCVQNQNRQNELSGLNAHISELQGLMLEMIPSINDEQRRLTALSSVIMRQEFLIENQIKHIREAHRYLSGSSKNYPLEAGLAQVDSLDSRLRSFELNNVQQCRGEVVEQLSEYIKELDGKLRELHNQLLQVYQNNSGRWDLVYVEHRYINDRIRDARILEATLRQKITELAN